jgi:hypothetical protein
MKDKVSYKGSDLSIVYIISQKKGKLLDYPGCHEEFEISEITLNGIGCGRFTRRSVRRIFALCYKTNLKQIVNIKIININQ